MNFSVGTDIVEVARVARLLERGGSRFTRHWFTAAEVTYCTAKAFPARHLAARIAAKESVLKAVHWRWVDRASWWEIEVAHDVDGVPFVDLHGSMAELVRERDVHLAVSLAHEREWVTATVIAWSLRPDVVRDSVLEREAIGVANSAVTIA